MIKKIFIMYLICECFTLTCIGHTVNVSIDCKTFEIKAIYNNETPMMNQLYIIHFLSDSNIYEKYLFGKTNIYGSLFFDSCSNITTYELEILSMEHSIHKKFELLSHSQEYENIYITSLKSIFFGLNWIVGVFGTLFYLFSKKNYQRI